MHVLILTFTFPPNKDGVSEAASAMASGFSDRGWDVTVLTEKSVPQREDLEWSGCHIMEYFNDKNVESGIQVFGHPGGYTDFLVSGNWDVIVIHSYGPLLYSALRVFPEISAAKIFVSHGYAALLWIRSPRFPYGLGVWLQSVLRSLKMPFWLPLFDRAVYLSETIDHKGFYDHFLARMIRYKGRRVIPNGVDLTERGQNPEKFRQRLGIPHDAFVFLCVANYSHRKDQGYAARSFRMAEIPGSVLVFIGSEFNESSHHFMQQDEQSAAMNPAGKIIWLEKQTRKETLAALAGCDAFVLSAYHEAQPIALLEAMREEKPWIARDAGCIATMEGGICVNSESAMAHAMTQLASDHTLRQRLACEGAAAVASFYNRSSYVASYCNLIEELRTRCI